MTRSKYARSATARTFPSLVSALTVALALAGQAACSSDTKHPSLISVGGDGPASAGSAGSANGGASGANDAGAGGESGEDTQPAAGSSGAGGSAPVVTPPLCSKTAVWSNPINVPSVTSNAGETLLSLTPDELDLAFLRGAALYVAHRAQVSAAFDLGPLVVIPGGWTAAAGASLSADGKRLLLTGDGESKLGELTRDSRTQPFSTTVDVTAFQALNHDAIYTGKVYAAPAVSPGDDQLFFNSAFPDGGSAVVVSTRTGNGPWSAPQRLASDALNGEIGKRRLPNSVSADALTLFYFNEESMQEEARWRDAATLYSPLYDMLSLGARRAATPNSACDRLYSESNSDVVVEKD